MDPWPCIPIFIIMTLLCLFIEVGNKAFSTQTHTGAKKLYSEESPKYRKLVDALEQSDKIIFSCEIAEIFLISAATYLITTKYGVIFFGLLDRIQILDAQASYFISCFLTFVITYLVLAIFAKSFPARFAAKYGDWICVALLPFLKFVAKLFAPLCAIINFFGMILARISGVTRDDIAEKVTEEEIRQMVDDSRESGNIEESAKEMIHGVFEFDDRIISEITTHRTDVVAVEENASLDEIMDIVEECGYSRIPVYRETLDDIIGLLYVKDLLKLLCSDYDSESFKLSDYIREAMYIPETANFKEVFEKFKSVRVQMAIVIDEYGGTSGIVTMEDLIESIMGSIDDEYDESDTEESKDIIKVSENEYIINGLTPVKDVEDEIGCTFTNDENCETIGGLVVSNLGIIPEEHELPELTFDNVFVKVISVAEHRVEKISIVVLKEQENNAENELQEA